MMGKHVHSQFESWRTERRDTCTMNHQHANVSNKPTFASSQPSILPDVPQSNWRVGLIDFEGGIDPGRWWRDARTGEM